GVGARWCVRGGGGGCAGGGVGWGGGCSRWGGEVFKSCPGGGRFAGAGYAGGVKGWITLGGREESWEGVESPPPVEGGTETLRSAGLVAGRSCRPPPGIPRWAGRGSPRRGPAGRALFGGACGAPPVTLG